jgi:hypothetical protein
LLTVKIFSEEYKLGIFSLGDFLQLPATLSLYFEETPQHPVLK